MIYVQMPIASFAFPYFKKKEERTITVKSIIEAVCESLELDEEQLKSSSRKRKLVDARYICYNLIRSTYPNMTLEQIGTFFRNRDHTTVMHGLSMTNAWLMNDSIFREKMDTVKAFVNQKNMMD